MAQFRTHATVALQAVSQDTEEQIPDHPPQFQHEAKAGLGAVEESSAQFKRVEFRVSENFLEGLDLLATAEGRTRADILRRALGLYARAAGEKANNRYLAFVEIKDDSAINVTEIIAL